MRAVESRSNDVIRPDAQSALIRSALDRILRSHLFVHAHRHRRFLEFVVNETLAGRADRLKGYTIGIEVFDRDRSFDPVSDPIVRVEAARLRARLREYYVGEGRSDPVRIELPKGSYAVNICPGEAAGTPELLTSLFAHKHAAEKPSLVVLPFANETADPGQDYFADGITEDLITDLSKISGLFVLSRHSSFAYRQTNKWPAAIVEELGVRYWLEGSVRREDGRIRISARLVDSDSGGVLWAERYDRGIGEVFAIQDEVTRAIVSALKIKLTGIESDRIGHEGTPNLEAHEALMRGVERFWHYRWETLAEAQVFFRRAVELDPSYALAHAWLARTYVVQYAFNWAKTSEDPRDFALFYAERAVEFDDSLSYAHAVLGWAQLWRKNGDAAIGECLRACTLDPNNADAHVFASLSLSAAGRAREGLRYIETAMRLNPHPHTLYFLALGRCLFALEAYEDAIAAFKRGAELNPDFISNHSYLAITCALAGREQEARAAAAAYFAINRDRPPCHVIWLDPRIMERARRGRRLAGLPDDAASET